MNKLPTASEALRESIKYKETKNQNKLLEVEVLVSQDIRQAITKGNTMCSFVLFSDKGKWIEDNVGTFKKIGYKVTVYMGKSPWIEVSWE